MASAGTWAGGRNSLLPARGSIKLGGYSSGYNHERFLRSSPQAPACLIPRTH